MTTTADFHKRAMELFDSALLLAHRGGEQLRQQGDVAEARPGHCACHSKNLTRRMYRFFRLRPGSRLLRSAPCPAQVGAQLFMPTTNTS